MRGQRPAIWNLAGQKILIVDDYAQMRSMIREMLQRCGADTIETASNGDAALESMHQTRPDIVLCDYHLGDGKDGQQVLEEARERELLPYSSIFILISAENTLDMVMGVVENEPDTYLVKPFTRDVLQNRLRRIQERKKNFAAISLAIQRREYHAAAQLCDRLLLEQPKYKADLLRLKGDALRRAGDHEACEALYREVLAERELSWAQLGLAHALLALQRLDDCEAILKSAVEQKLHFVAAWDLLAEVQKSRGEQEESEQSLSQAVSLSPKNLRRQQALGEVALANGHLDVAEKAWRSAVREGRYSAFGSPRLYGGLAQVQIESGDTSKAMNTIGRMQQHYSNADDSAKLQSAALSATLCHSLGDLEASKKAAKEAAKLAQACPDALSRDEMMQLAETCMANGDKDQAGDLVKHLVRGDHEDQAMIERAQALFDKAGMTSEGKELIEDECDAMVELNNEAVQLMQAGQLREAAGKLIKAAQSLPDNLTINLNAAQCMLQLMQTEGVNARLLRQAQNILEHFSDQAGSDERYADLLKRSRELEAQRGQAA